MIPRSKKGVFDLPLEQTVGLILAVMFVILMLAVIMGLMRAFSAPPDQGTTTRFYQVYDAINVMMNPENKNETCMIRSIYVSSDFAIVGFNKDGELNVAGQAGYVNEYCGFFKDKVNKPDSCMDKACICLCRSGSGDVTKDDCSKKGSACLRLDSVTTLKSQRDIERDLVLYGKSCMLESKKAVIDGYVVKKTGTSIKVEEVLSSGEMLKNLKVPYCTDIIKSFRTGSIGAIVKSEEKKEAPKSSFCEDSKNTGGGCSGAQISVPT